MTRVLYGIHEAYGYLPWTAAELVAIEFGKTMTDVYTVASLLSNFRGAPEGKGTAVPRGGRRFTGNLAIAGAWPPQSPATRARRAARGRGASRRRTRVCPLAPPRVCSTAPRVPALDRALDADAAIDARRRIWSSRPRRRGLRARRQAARRSRERRRARGLRRRERVRRGPRQSARAHAARAERRARRARHRARDGHHRRDARDSSTCIRRRPARATPPSASWRAGDDIEIALGPGRLHGRRRERAAQRARVEARDGAAAAAVPGAAGLPDAADARLERRDAGVAAAGARRREGGDEARLGDGRGQRSPACTRSTSAPRSARSSTAPAARAAS